jgi:hypothetical protein
MLFDPIACGDSHLLSSPHVMLPRHPRMLLAGIQRCGVSGGFETRPYGFFGAARRAVPCAVQGCTNAAGTHGCARAAAPCLSRALCDVHGCYECREAANSHEPKITIRAQTVLAHTPGLSCGARRAPTGWRIKNQNRARSAHNQDVAFDVGTRSRRRASEPRPGGFASRCLSRARFVRSASSARARTRREAQGVSAAPGRAFFGLPFFARAKKGNPPPRGKRHIAVQASPQAIQKETVQSVGHATWTLRMPIHE